MSLPLSSPENMEDYEFYCRLLAWRQLIHVSDARRELSLRHQQLRVALDQEMTLIEQDYAAARQHLIRVALTLNAAKQVEVESNLLGLMGSTGRAAPNAARTSFRNSIASGNDARAENFASYESMMNAMPPHLLKLFRGGNAPAARTRRGRNGGSAAGHSAQGDAVTASVDLNGVNSGGKMNAGNSNGAAGTTGEVLSIAQPTDGDVWMPITTPGMMLSESVRSLAMPPVRAPASWLRSSTLISLTSSGALSPDTIDAGIEEQPRIRVALEASEIQRDMRQVSQGIRLLERAKAQQQESNT
jgi:hypothetical protein